MIKREKIQPITYQLVTNSFEEGWNKLKNSLVEVNNLFSETESTPEAVMKRMSELFIQHVPSISKNKGLSWSLHAQTMRASLKAGAGISYGWIIDSVDRKDIKTTGAKIEQITFSVILYSENIRFYQEKALKDAGFTKAE